MVRAEHLPEAWWWISFSTKIGAIGAVNVRAESGSAALARCRELGIHPEVGEAAVWMIPERELPAGRFMPGKTLREMGYLPSRSLPDQRAVAYANNMTAIVERDGAITREEIEIGDGIFEVGQIVERLHHG